jgi:hypothetical protein
VKAATIGIRTLADYSVWLKDHQHLVNAISDVPLQRRVLVGVASGGGGSSSEAWPRVAMIGVLTTALVVTRIATLIPSVPLGLLRVRMQCSCVMLCCLPVSLPTSARWSSEVVACLSHLIKLQCKTFTRI